MRRKIDRGGGRRAGRDRGGVQPSTRRAALRVGPGFDSSCRHIFFIYQNKINDMI